MSKHPDRQDRQDRVIGRGSWFETTAVRAVNGSGRPLERGDSALYEPSVTPRPVCTRGIVALRRAAVPTEVRRGSGTQETLADDADRAMAHLYLTYADGVRRLARSLTSATAADPDDVVQETFVKVWRAAAAFDPQRGTEAAFVFTIARRVIIDRWRKAMRRPVTAAMDQLRHTPDRARRCRVRPFGRRRRGAHRGRLALTAAPGGHRAVVLARPQPAGDHRTRGRPTRHGQSRMFHALRELRRHLPRGWPRPIRRTRRRDGPSTPGDCPGRR